MKSEKEIKWISILYKSSYCKHLLKNLKIYYKSGCIKDFERLLGCSENEKEFRFWFRKLRDIDVFVHHGEVNRGNGVFPGYIVDGNRLIQYSKENPLYEVMKKFFDFDRVIL